MRIIRGLYGLLALVLTALIVLAGTWVPEALLEKKAESLSSGKTAVVNTQEVTPYTYTMSMESRILKLTDFLLELKYETGLDAGMNIRDPLDTELTQQQAVDRAADFLQKLNAIYQNWGLDPMFYPAADYYTVAGDTETEAAVAAENTAGIGAVEEELDAGTATDGAYPSITDTMESYFIVDDQEQQLSLWWLRVPDSYGNMVDVALDAVTGLPVLVYYLAGYEASMIEYADAVSETYASIYGSEYTFASAAVAEKPGVGYVEYPEYVIFTCEGKTLSLEYQYYYSGKDTGDKAQYTYLRPGEVWIWLCAS